LTSGYDGKLWVWSVHEGKLVRDISITGGPVISLATTNDDLLAAALCSGDKTLKLIDMKTWKFAGQLDGVGYPVGSVVFSGDGQWLAAGGGDSPVRLWKRRSFE
jgi:WD40 repeat protein